MKEIVEIFSNDEDYKKPNMYYHCQITAASAFSISTPEFLSAARSILKHKTQTEKRLATPKIATYRIWEPAKGHLENNIEIANVPETIQNSKQKKKVYFDAPMKPKTTIIIK